jgi:O-antigen biosynthesis protein
LEPVSEQRPPGTSNPQDGHAAGAQHAFSADEVLLDQREVRNCFQLFLGRMPANTATDLPETSNLSVLLRHIFETDEFKNGILQSVLLREALPHSALGDVLLLPLVDWAQRRLPLDVATRRSVGAARNWSQLLELLLADPNLIALAPHLVTAEVDRLLRQRLDTEPLSRVRRSVIGAVDAASAFEVRGWAVDLCDKSVPVNLEFYADNTFLGSITCSEPRPDVRDVVGGDGKVGFVFKISTAHRSSFARGRTLTVIDSVSRDRVGPSTVVYAEAAQNWDAVNTTRSEIAQLRQVLDRIEARLPEIGRMASIPLEAYGEYWDRFYRPTPDVCYEQSVASRRFTYRPLISVVIPAWNSNTRLLDKAVGSVRAQTYDHWELIISDDASDHDELKALKYHYAAEPRIRWVETTERTGIAGNTNRGIAASSGDYIAFLDHDDEFAPGALYQVVLSLQQQRYGLLYSDEDRVEENEFGQLVHHTPFFKPGYDPDLLLAVNYLCHLVVVRRDVVTAVGGLRPGFEGAQDHEFLLRVVDSLSPRDIRHLSRVLYHWRVTPGSVSRTPEFGERIQKNIETAVAEHLRRVGGSAEVEAHNDPVGSSRQFAARVRWNLPSLAPKVSMIIATRDRLELLRPCISSVVDSMPAYPGDYEILILDNDSSEPATLEYFAGLAAHPNIRIIRFRGPFNYSAINNAGAREASGEVLIFLNNDTMVLTRDWCSELVAHAMREDVGAAGARLLFADGTIQHCGVLMGVEGVAGHECVGDTPQSGGYFGRTHLLRSTAAVTGACLATRRSIFLGMDGGFDELYLKIAFNDVDYCMRLRKAGYRIVYNPFAVLYHFESKSRGREISEAQLLRHRSEAQAFYRRWTPEEIVDPYYNLHFERFARPFERLRPPPDYSEA